MTSFCDNPLCPHHKLEMNDEKHYHDTDEGVVGSICGILKTRLIQMKVDVAVKKKKFRFYKFINVIEYKTTIKKYYFCDICYNMSILLKGIEYE